MKQICKRKQSTKNNLGPIGTIFPLSLDAQRTHITMDFLKITRNIKTVWKTVKELITIKQRNDLPLTTLKIGKKKFETDAKEIANHFNGYFISIAGELNKKIVKSENMHLLYVFRIHEGKYVSNTNNTKGYSSLNRQYEGK